MNVSLIFKVPEFLRKGHEFVDAVKSGKQAAIVAALGAVLAIVAPFIGGQLDVHPWLAFFFSETGIQAIGALITGLAAIAYRLGSSPERGILPPKPAATDGPAGNDPAPARQPASPGQSVPSAPAPSDDPSSGVPLGG